MFCLSSARASGGLNMMSGEPCGENNCCCCFVTFMLLFMYLIIYLLIYLFYCFYNLGKLNVPLKLPLQSNLS